jgi:Ca2+ transporting ATPase
MSIILEIKGESYLFIKGASEIILKSCQFWLNGQSTQVEPLDSSIREQIGETINTMASNSLRTLSLAFKKLTADQDLSQKNRRGVYNV